MSARDDYVKAMRALHVLIATGEENSNEAAMLRDGMDTAWDAMTEEDRDEVSKEPVRCPPRAWCAGEGGDIGCPIHGKKEGNLLKKVFFIRAGDLKAKVLAEQSLREIIKWLDAGYGFDIVLERRDE